MKLSETRPRACKRCSLACMQSEQAEGGRVQSMSNQIGCGHQAQQGPRRRRCLSGKSHLCPSSSQYPLVLQRLHPRQNVAFAEHDDTFLRVHWTIKDMAGYLITGKNARYHGLENVTENSRKWQNSHTRIPSYTAHSSLCKGGRSYCFGQTLRKPFVQNSTNLDICCTIPVLNLIP